jgi:hypothetical protein
MQAGAKVLVRQWRDGTVKLYAGTQQLRWQEIERRPKTRPVRQRVTHRAKVIPAANDPWRGPLKDRRAASLPFPPENPRAPRHPVKASLRRASRGLDGAPSGRRTQIPLRREWQATDRLSKGTFLSRLDTLGLTGRGRAVPS